MLFIYPDAPADAAAFAKRNAFTIPTLLDNDGSVALKYLAPGQPPSNRPQVAVMGSTVVIDKDGKITYFALRNKKQFDAEYVRIRELLAKKP